MERPRKVRNDLLVCLLLAMVTLAVYWQVLSHDFVNFDDNLYITENSHVQEGLTSESIIWAFTQRDISYWHPMTWLSLMLDYEFYGLSPGGFHLTNLLLHALGTMLLFFALHVMTGSLWRSGFVAFLFALHPLNVESVAWVVERKNVLSTCFWMLTILTYGYYTQRPILRRYLLVLFCFTLGLMAKPLLVTVPCVLLLLDYWPLARFHLPQLGRDSEAETHTLMLTGSQKSPMYRLVLEKIPFLALSVVSISLSLWSGKHPDFLLTTETIPMSLRVGNALISYAAYIGKMIWPSNLAVFYPPPGTLAWSQVAAPALVIVLVSMVVLWLARPRPYILVGWLWYLGTLVPFIGLVQAGLWPAMADRFVYVPLIGLFIIIAWGVPDLLAEYRYRLAIMTLAAGIVLSALAVRTWTQLRHWRNSITLFEHTVQVTSNNYLAHNNLGVAKFQRGKLDEAILHYTEALGIKPDYAYTHYNLGLALERRGRLDQAILHYTEALRIKPDYAKVHNNLGFALGLQGRLEEAISHYYEALQIRPDYFRARYNLADALAEQGRIDQAIVHFSKAVSLEPNSAEVHNDLGDALARQGKFDQAIVHFSKAVSLEPNLAVAHSNLGKGLARQGKFDQAIVHFSKALSLEPNSAESHHHLGSVLLKQGKLDEAKAHYSKALDLRPDYPEAHNNLGVALFQLGSFEEALAHFSEAIRLNPYHLQAQNNKELVLQAMGKSE
jgi:tetratricopeptide (TPR) repeat protein